MKNTNSMSLQQTDKPAPAGNVLFAAIALGIVLLGLTAFFEIGFFKEPGSIELVSKILVGTAVIGFFAVILLELLSELSSTISQSIDQKKI